VGNDATGIDLKQLGTSRNLSVNSSQRRLIPHCLSLKSAQGFLQLQYQIHGHQTLSIKANPGTLGRTRPKPLFQS
jgi:hypothetical protein